MQATRPQTLAYALNDSPVAQLAWIAEKLHEWTAEELDRDLVLTIASLSWFTGSGASSAHATYEGMQAFRQMAAQGGGHGEAPPGPPQAVAVFAADTTIRSVMDPEGAIDRWTEYDRGGHFPGLEVPDLLARDLREFFAAYR
jgi:hypothetical protein